MNQNAREVLIANSKAMLEGEDNGIYAAVRADGVLCWYDKDGNERCPVALHVAFRQDWVPYHEVKEIRPEKTGEVWDLRGNKFFLLSLGSHQRFSAEDGTILDVEAHVIHNKNGWTRLYRPVEDEIDNLYGKSIPSIMDAIEPIFAMPDEPVLSSPDIEKIEIDRIEWSSDGEVVFPRGGYMAWKGLVGRPPMKMILLAPKEEHERQD